MARKNTVKVQLVSELDTGATYHTVINFRTAQNKLRLRKYDYIAKQHAWFTEKKLPGAKKVQ